MKNACLISFIILLLSIIAGGCNSPESSSNKIFIDLSDNIERSEDLSPEIEKIEFFQISDGAPIDKIKNPQLADNCIFFYHRGGKNWSKCLGIVAVDLDGNILWNYNKIGKGPKEFEYIAFVTYLPHSKQIAVLDNRLERMTYLGLNGEFIKTVKFDQGGQSAAELENGNLVVNNKINSQMWGSTLELQNDLTFFDQSLNPTQSFLPHRHNGIGWFWFGETLLRGEKQILYTNTFQYTVFNVTPEGVDSTWKLDFGAYNTDTAKYTNPQTQEEAMMENTDEEVMSIRLNHSEKNLWVLVPLQKKQVLAVINKKKHNIKYYQKPEKGHFLYNGIPVPMFSLTQNGNKLVYSISALDALENWDKLTEEQQASSDPEWAALIAKIDPESNPIMCILYMK